MVQSSGSVGCRYVAPPRAEAGELEEIREQLMPYIEQQVGILIRAVDALMKNEIDPTLRDLADKDPEAYLRHIEASGGSAPAHEQLEP